MAQSLISKAVEDFEMWAESDDLKLSTAKTFDGEYPVYENVLTMAMFGAFYAGYMWDLE